MDPHTSTNTTLEKTLLDNEQSASSDISGHNTLPADLVFMPLESTSMNPSMSIGHSNDGELDNNMDEYVYEEGRNIDSAEQYAGVLEENYQHPQRTGRQSTASSSMTSIVEEEESVATSGTIRSRSYSSDTSSSAGSTHVDWDELEKSEEQEPRDEGSDESTAFLLARLEQENNALATDPKAGISRTPRDRRQSRPPSIQHLKKLVNESTKPSLRYSQLPNPPMTELEFWAALVLDYPQTAQRLPTLTSNKIRSGVPPPLRGVVWMSIAGARDRLLEEEYDRLCGESSPYEKLIDKDIGRSFPGVEMFRDPAGDGQKMLGRVLNSFSLYDQKIGYCQGLGFVVGPLLMHMGDKDAFCVLVRLMEHYDLRSCFLPDLSGLHLRIYQFQHLLSQHLPILASHLDTLQIEPLYVSQWFLSFFAVTCPLNMLLRIYDVILTEGASETLMRVALSLMRRNETRILGCSEFEDIMQLLLSRELWDTYGCNADDLVNDFIGLTGLVTRENLEALEVTFKNAQREGSMPKFSSLPNVQAAASRFLGRFWAGSHSSTKSLSPSSGLAAPSRPSSFLMRTPSKQSMASTLNSIDSVDSQPSTVSTEATAMSREPSADCTPTKPGPPSITNTLRPSRSVGITNKDKDLHGQIEDLLTAMSDMQREQTTLFSELQKEREEREEDRLVVQRTIERVKRNILITIPEDLTEQPIPASGKNAQMHDTDDAWAELEEHFIVAKPKRSSIVQTKHQLRDDAKRWKDQYDVEAMRSAELSRQLSDQELEVKGLREQLREVRSRVKDTHTEKQRLEKSVQELKSRLSSTSDSALDMPSSPSDTTDGRPGGLRQLKLGRSGSMCSQSGPQFSKRTSSLGLQSVLATENHKPVAEDALLIELVHAKTAEAVARQELEEVKGKLDSLRKMFGGSPASPVGGGHRPSPSEPCIPKNPGVITSGFTMVAAARAVQQDSKVTPPSSSSGGFFSGWGRRTVSNSGLSAAEAR